MLSLECGSIINNAAYWAGYLGQTVTNWTSISIVLDSGPDMHPYMHTPLYGFGKSRKVFPANQGGPSETSYWDKYLIPHKSDYQIW